jgi:hypothetical protein
MTIPEKIKLITATIMTTASKRYKGVDDEIGEGDVGVAVGMGVAVGVGANVAEMVYAVWTLLKVYELTAPTELPFTATSTM